MQKYIFRKYNPVYKDFFISEKTRIKKAIGWAGVIEHIGSTAVPGLGGKGIIDIAIGTKKAAMQRIKKKLEEIGYEFSIKGSYPERLFFWRDCICQKRKIRTHIHLTNKSGKDWREMIDFRDHLLENPETVKEYIILKKEAVRLAQGDGEKYKKHKARFIEIVLGR